MISSKAPAGVFTRVRVVVTLSNERFYSFVWDTPMTVSAALHKAPRWARHDMATAKVSGRSKIVGLEAEARYVAGTYSKGKK